MGKQKVSAALSEIRKLIEQKLASLKGDKDYIELCEEIASDMEGRLDAMRSEGRYD